jgi:peptide/nickel transport system ATP-binding protein
MLTVTDLRTYFDTEDGIVRAVDGVNFAIDKGKTLAIVGESGCGKSVTAFSIMRILACPPGRIAGGSVALDGRELLPLSERQMREVRGGKIGMIFQEPMTSLNPVFTCGSQIVEAIELHRGVLGAAARELAIDMLRKVGIPEPAMRFSEYPHQLSGGMRQRVMIAMALSCAPDVLIADEPTTALDVTIQAQILDLLRELQEHEQMSILLITHDLGVVAELAHEVAVMYAGRIVERTDAKELYSAPRHPYTRGLFRSLPKLGEKRSRLDTIPGSVPNPLHLPSGCPFHSRCDLARTLAQQNSQGVSVECDGQACTVFGRCVREEPALVERTPGHWCACWGAA